MHTDQAEQLLVRIEKQWPQPELTDRERAEWTAMLTAGDFSYEETLAQLTEWSRKVQGMGTIRPEPDEIARMVAEWRPPMVGDPMPADVREGLRELNLRAEREPDPPPDPPPTCASCGLPFLPGSPLIERGYCADCEF